MLGELLAAGYAAIVIWGLLISVLPIVIGGSLWKIKLKEMLLLIAAFAAGVILIRFVEEPKEAFGYVTEPLYVTLSGEIISIKDNADYSNVILENTEVVYNGTKYRVDGILLYLSEVSGLQIGDVIATSGELSSFLLPRNNGEFNLYNYYKSMGIYYQVKMTDNTTAPKVMSVKKFPVSEWINTLRTRLVHKLLEHCYSVKDAGTMSAILLGEKGYLDEELNENFRISGISHVLVVSGLHISLIGMGIFEVLKRLMGYMPACIAACVAVVFYVWLTGFGASGQRALIMFVISMSGNFMGRSYDLNSGIGMALLGMLIKAPYLFLGSGFILSFLSVFAIGTIVPVLEDMCKWAFNKKMSGIISGTAVFWVTLPAVIWNYYEYSLYSLLLNILIIPCMSVLVILGAGGLLGEVFFGAGEILLKGPVHVLLWSFEKMSLFFNEMSIGRILFGKPQTWQLLSTYTMLSFIICGYFIIKQLIKRKKRFPAAFRKKKVRYILAVLFISGVSIIEIFILLPKNKRGLEITMLDVGQGECIFMEFSTGECILLDAGSTDVKRLYEKRLEQFFKAKAIDKLDYIILTHADYDHCGAIEDILNGMDVGCLVLPKVNGEDSNLDKLLLLAQGKGCSVTLLGRGDEIKAGGAVFYCLNPDSYEYYTEDKRNDSSIVLHMKYYDFDMLLTGDISETAEKELAEYLKNCEVLKAAHHGSRYSNSESLLKTVSPQIAIISCSENNSYGHPHTETIKRLSEAGCSVFITKDCGAITITVDKGKLRISSFIKRR